MTDASIIPFELSAHLSSTVYGIAEKVCQESLFTYWNNHQLLTSNSLFLGLGFDYGELVIFFLLSISSVEYSLASGRLTLINFIRLVISLSETSGWKYSFVRFQVVPWPHNPLRAVWDSCLYKAQISFRPDGVFELTWMAIGQWSGRSQSLHVSFTPHIYSIGALAAH